MGALGWGAEGFKTGYEKASAVIRADQSDAEVCNNSIMGASAEGEGSFRRHSS